MKSTLLAWGALLLVTGTWQPVSAQTEPGYSLPQAAHDMMSKLVGTWTLQANRNGESGEELYQVRWNPSHTGLELYLCNLEDGSVSRGLGRWDAASNEFVENWTGALPSVELRYRSVGPEDWQGTAVVFEPDGTRKEGTASVKFTDEGFVFTGKAEDVSAHNVNQRITLAESLESLKDWADLAVGGTWVSDDGANRHTYTWRPGEKVLLLDRRGEKYPGLSMITIDHQAECVRWHEVDDNGMSGSAISWQVGEGEWRLVGRYESKDTSQFLVLTAKRMSRDEIHVSGKEILNGEATELAVKWKRENK